MRTLPFLAVLAILAGMAMPADPPRTVVLFAPYDDVESEVRQRIASARDSVRVLAYSFTSRPIAQALVDAKGRGVDVKVIADRSLRTARGGEAAFLHFGEIPVKLDASHPIAHSKVIIVDGETVITGSYNWTENAKRNGENCIFIRDAALAKKYLDNWTRHEAHSADYEPPK